MKRHTPTTNPKANIALLKSDRVSADAFKGWFRFLVENHFLFDTLTADAALDLAWDKYQAIVLPDVRPMSDELAVRELTGLLRRAER